MLENQRYWYDCKINRHSCPTNQLLNQETNFHKTWYEHYATRDHDSEILMVWIWKLVQSEMWGCVAWSKGTTISQEYGTSIFMAEEHWLVYCISFLKFWEWRYSDMTGPCDLRALSLMATLTLKQWDLADCWVFCQGLNHAMTLEESHLFTAAPSSLFVCSDSPYRFTAKELDYGAHLGKKEN
jgi:hypothetical protein